MPSFNLMPSTYEMPQEAQHHMLLPSASPSALIITIADFYLFVIRSVLQLIAGDKRLAGGRDGKDGLRLTVDYPVLYPPGGYKF
jgi:hypothetical protein